MNIFELAVSAAQTLFGANVITGDTMLLVERVCFFVSRHMGIVIHARMG